MKKQILSLMVMLSLTYFTANVICAEIYSPKWDKVEIKVQERRTAKTYVITDWPESVRVSVARLEIENIGMILSMPGMKA